MADGNVLMDLMKLVVTKVFSVIAINKEFKIFYKWISAKEFFFVKAYLVTDSRTDARVVSACRSTLSAML